MVAIASSRLKRAELASGLGALVLGIGLGALMAHTIGRLDLAFVVLGTGLHGWGMYDKHRIEAGAVRPVWWSEALYWICWALLIGMIAYLASHATG